MYEIYPNLDYFLLFKGGKQTAKIWDEDQANSIVQTLNDYNRLVKAAKFALTTPGMIKGRDELVAALPKELLK